MSDVVSVIQPAPVITSVMTVGQQGPAGPAGANGTGDSRYDHDQMVPSASWVVLHNLGKHPSVTVIDSANSMIEGHVQYDSNNQLTLSFSSAFSGHAYLN